MKKQLNQLRRFFARTGTRKLNAATAREVIPASYDDDDGSNRLSGAFIVVLLLHVIALVGVFAFSRMKDPKPSSAQGPTTGNTSGAAGTQASVAAAPKVTAPAMQADSAPAQVPSNPAPTLVASNTKNAAIAATEAAIVSERLASARPASTQASGRSYVVKSGDNLTKIAVAYGVRPADLIAANGLKGDDIKPGQELTIPDAKSAKSTAETKPVERTEKAAPTTAKSTNSSYVVRKNETLIKIARELGVKYEDLAKINNIKDPQKLREGQVLKVPRKS